eukprot:766114-Hanusia_phi.AAC.11
MGPKRQKASPGNQAGMPLNKQPATTVQKQPAITVQKQPATTEQKQPATTVQAPVQHRATLHDVLQQLMKDRVIPIITGRAKTLSKEQQLNIKRNLSMNLVQRFNECCDKATHEDVWQAVDILRTNLASELPDDAYGKELRKYFPTEPASIDTHLAMLMRGFLFEQYFHKKLNANNQEYEARLKHIALHLMSKFPAFSDYVAEKYPGCETPGQDVSAAKK